MGQFLRDQKITNVKIDEQTLDRIDDFFLHRVAAHNTGIPEGPGPLRGVYFYVIRFDEKGYRFVNFSDVKKCFRDAGEVERVIYTMDTGDNRQSAGLFGSFFEVRFDAKEPNNCWVTVTAGSQDWVDATFAGIADILNSQRSASRFVRTQWTGLLIQIVGVAVGFLLSLWAAIKAAPRLAVDNAFVISFFFALLIYSNIWSYVTAQIGKLIDFAFPNIRFKRVGKDWFHASMQYAIGSLLIVLVAFLLDKLFDLAGKAIGILLK